MNDIQSLGGTAHLHTIAVPLDVAVSRMPTAVRAGWSVVELQHDADQTTWAWSGSRSRGSVRLEALSAAATAMTITVDAGAGAVDDALAVALYGVLERQWAPPPTTAPTGLGRVGKIAVGAVAVLVPVLAITGMRVLSPPAPLDAASAVNQFREESAQQDEQLAAAAEPAADEQKRRDGRSDAGKVRSRAKSASTPVEDDAATTQSKTSSSGGGGGGTESSGRRVAAQDEQQASRTAKSGGGSQRESGRRKAMAQEPAAPARPEAGVYRYATNGYESIDRPSSRHDYPKETFTTVRHSDCGFDLRWQPFENRWDRMSMCSTQSGSFIAGLGTHREFYGQENDTDYTCSRGTYAYRPQPGAVWSGTCADGESKMQLRGRTLARENIQVGNETVDAVHFIIEGRLSGGDAEGTWKAERWVDAKTGLVFRLEAQTQATSKSSVGSVQYREQLSLRLLSTTPER